MRIHTLRLSAILLCVSLAACEQKITDRSGRLLSMAAEEAKGIPSTLERSTRQLNVADTQIRTARPSDAAQTLKLAAQTLAAAPPDQFDDFHRIAGWTSISELARRAQDHAMAMDASQKALDALNNVQPAWAPAQYVDSLATEIDALRGHPDAIELLATGASWGSQIDDRNTRRIALFIFADHLVQLDAFDPARAVLERDPDAAWRTDTLLALANRYSAQPRYPRNPASSMGSMMNLRNSLGAGGGGGFGGGGQGAASPTSASFGKDVRFESVFKQSQ